MPTDNNPFFLKRPEQARQGQVITSDGKQFTATNRKSISAGRALRAESMADPIMSALESTPDMVRGDRKRPSILKFPIEIGSGEVPHVMQFQIFWRQENKDLTDAKGELSKAKQENERKLQTMNTISSLIDKGNFTYENVAKSPLSDTGIAEIRSMVKDNSLLKVVDPSVNDNLANLLNLNPGEAKFILEQTIKSQQKKVDSIAFEIENGAGAMGFDDNDKLLLENRFQGAVNRTTATGGGVLGGLFGLGIGALMGGPIGAVAGGIIGAAGGVGVQQGAKKLQAGTKYDQMVSIYLPFCTKINNEDSFSYEDSEMKAAGAIADAIGSDPLNTAKQVGLAAVDMVADSYGQGAVAKSLTGTVLNPRLAKLFKQKEFRTFSFMWEFYPRSREEVEMIRDIIETFRYHAHPAKFGEADGAQIQLRVPAEFRVRFLSTNSDKNNQAGFVENEYLPRIGYCALSSIAVDYSPNGTYSSLLDNSPTAITLSLNFSEMDVLTRDKIEEGF